jgi:hypothetical protein
MTQTVRELKQRGRKKIDASEKKTMVYTIVKGKYVDEAKIMLADIEKHFEKKEIEEKYKSL